MVITLGLVNGFQQTVASKVYSFWGDARVQSIAPPRSQLAEDLVMTTDDSLELILRQEPAIAGFFPYLSKSVVLKTGSQFEGVMIKGVDKRFNSEAFGVFLTGGRMPAFPDTGYTDELLISEFTAGMLQVKAGDKLSCFYIKNGSEIRSRLMTVAGLYKTGVEEYDKAFAIADIRFMQRLQQVPGNTITGYQITMGGNRNQHAAQCKTISDKLPQGIVCNPVRELYGNIFDWLEIQDQTKQIVVGIMMAVAAINLITCLLILVIERTRMVGVLKAVGMDNARIKQVFWYYALYISLMGIGIGLAISLLLLWLQYQFGFIQMDESTYYVAVLPVKIIWWQVAAIVVGTFTVCAVTLRLPLVYVTKTNIVKALRFS